MSNRTVISLLGAALLASAATGAHADGVKKVTDFSVRAEPVAVSPQGTKSLKWDARAGRWGVTLNLDQPSNRDAQLNDIQAGAYFRVTPSLRIGGAVASWLADAAAESGDLDYTALLRHILSASPRPGA